MPKIVCMKCGMFFHPKKNGVVVEEGMPVGDPVEGEKWVPYKLWSADLLECRVCGTEIVAGFGQQPFAEHFEKDYDQRKAAEVPVVFVKDCA